MRGRQDLLQLGLVGNCSVGALIDGRGEFVWACLPRFDGDPVFCSLLRPRIGEGDFGFFAIELTGLARSEQEYLANTAVLVTRLYDGQGNSIEIQDFSPRFRQFGRIFRPMMFVRRVARLSGSPRVRICLRPAYGYGASRPEVTHGSHHIRYVMPDIAVRLPTDVPITSILEEMPFFLEQTATLLLGPDETVPGAVPEVGRRFLEETIEYWREWVGTLSIPYEWQDQVIRAAITLKLNAFDDTGAIVAAMTTSIPESPHSGRNWDYRYCWLRDGYFVVNALTRLGTTHTMDRYLGYMVNVAAGSGSGLLQPVYRIDGRSVPDEWEATSLPGYRGMGPVRVGNQAYRQLQNDVYGSAVLAATHVFFDRRLARAGDAMLFQRLEPLGEKALEVFDQPDAGIWERRGASRVHTFSSVMCWAACDRLSKIAQRLGAPARADYWSSAAQRIHRFVCERMWSDKRRAFVAAAQGEELDASLLLLHEIGFLSADDPRFASTVAAIEGSLRKGDFVYRYVEADDFGVPSNAFLVCTFWYIYALAALGRAEEAKPLFEKLLACSNRHGLLAEHVDPVSGEQWGNFPQTYSMVGLINSAIRLSKPWDQAF